MKDYYFSRQKNVAHLAVQVARFESKFINKVLREFRTFSSKEISRTDFIIILENYFRISKVLDDSEKHLPRGVLG